MALDYTQQEAKELLESNTTYVKCEECGHEDKVKHWTVVELEGKDENEGLFFRYTVCPLCGAHYLVSVLDDVTYGLVDGITKKRLRVNKMMEEGTPTSVINNELRKIHKEESYIKKLADRLKDGHPKVIYPDK